MTSHLFCVGGKNPSKNFHITEYSPTEQEWSRVYKSKGDRFRFGITSIGTKIYLLGGIKGHSWKYDLQVFDCQNRSLKKLKHARRKVYLFDFSLASLGNLLFTSGGYKCCSSGQNTGYYDSSGNYHITGTQTSWVEPTNVTSYHDLDADKAGWTEIASMQCARSGHTMLAHNGLLYCLGGDEGRSTVDEYHPARNEWIGHNTSVQSQTYSSSALHQIDNAIYLLGEQFFQMYPLGNFQSTITLPMPSNVRASSLVSYNGKLLAVGGCLRDSIHKLATVNEFDSRNQKWIPFPGLDVPRKRHSCIVVDY